MAPRKSSRSRKAPANRNEESEATAQIDRIVAERLAAAIPDLISKISESLLQNIHGSTPSGGGSGSEDPPRGNNLNQGPVMVNDDPPKGCSYKTFMGCKPPEFNGTEGATGTLQWMEKIESVFQVCACAEENKVSYATFLFQGLALTWWNTIVRTRGRGEILIMTWEQFRVVMKEEYVPEHEIERLEQELWSLSMQGSDIRGYTNRFYELSQLVPRLVRPESKRVGRYIQGLPVQIRGNVIASRPGTLQSAIVIANTLVDSQIREGTMIREEKKNADSKRGRTPQHDYGRKKTKEEADYDAAPLLSYGMTTTSERKGYSGPWPKCDKCGRHHLPDAACWVCTKCKMLGHTEKYCKTCFDCEKQDHRKDKCPKRDKTGDGARGRVFMLGTQ